MNKLEKWLWVNCTLKDNGQNSNSLYFYYKNLEKKYNYSDNTTGTFK